MASDRIKGLEDAAIKRFIKGSELSEYYYKAPLIVAYSGGKDSDVLVNIAEKSGKPFECIYSVTTLDAPQTTRHMNEVFARLEAKGIKCTRKSPTYHGEPTNMWKLIKLKEMPPTRRVRYCCQILKETSTPNRMVALGVRRAESFGRSSRGEFEYRTRTAPKKGSNAFDYDHTKQVFDDAVRVQQELNQSNNEPNSYDCTFISKLKKQKDTVVNPIIDWTDTDIWDYIRAEDIETNPLYFPPYNFARVGCIGCPMAGTKGMLKEFALFPDRQEKFIRAFDEMIAYRVSRGLETKWKTGEEVFHWWVGDNILPGQTTLFDLVDEEGGL